MLRALGLACSVLYAALIVWLYVAQPQSVREVTGGLAAEIGAYRVDRQHYEDGLAFFRRDQFVEARAAFVRADPAARDPQTQFYIAYSYYRQGWGRVYDDDELFRQGLAAVDRAILVAPGHRVVVQDPDLGMQTADELRAELERGMTRDVSDLNPAELFRSRK